MIRTFIAIPIPKNISLFLGRIQGELKATRVKASWTRTSSMHLTLRFMGDIPEGNLKHIIRAMKETANTNPPFTLSTKSVGVFPGIKNARVIWAGVAGGTDQLKSIQRTLEKRLEPSGFPADTRPFSPHFTLGRLKTRPDRSKVIDIIQNFEQFRSKPWRVESMILFKSDLNPSGAVHTPLFEAMFAPKRRPK